MTACVQSVAMFSSELWWKGDHVRGTMGQTDELQLLVNQEVWVTKGCFRTTNLGAMLMESGLRAATVQFESRQRQLGLRLLTLTCGDQAREVFGALTVIGWRLSMFTDGSWPNDGANGYAVVWKAGQNLEGHQNPYGLQPGGLRRCVHRSCWRAASGITWNTIPERVTIFSDAQAAIRRMA